jgi:HSP20 family protein
MSISQWNPWNDVMSLRDAMDEMMRESFVRPRMGGAMGLAIPIDVYETSNDYIVYATMPGVDPQDVHIQVQANTVRITGDMKEEHEPGSQTTQQQTQQQGQQQGQQQARQGHWLLRERRTGHFVRTITLPMNVEAGEAQAEFKNGMLIVRLPKAAEARARAIPIRAAGGSQPIEAQSRT